MIMNIKHMELKFSLLVYMGVKVSLSPSRVCPRTGCWSTYL